mmetsp:Transcript_65360/g.210683  ORF Transcript_65360/g.210683 Transcript_65360/m.210683 type:complete len:637 (+) Transcript_65360:76-1986(+)
MPPRALQVMSQVHGTPLVGARPGRRCTDALCCLVFMLAILAMLALGGLGVRYGDTQVLVRFARGRDNQGRICGVDTGVEEFGLTYFTLPNGSKPIAPGHWSAHERSLLRPVCTSKCPQTVASDASGAVRVREADLCPPEAYPDMCTWYGGNTSTLAYYCVDLQAFHLDWEWQQWLQDLRTSAPALAVVPFVAILLGFLFLGFVTRCGSLCIWITLCATILIPAAAGIWIFQEAHSIASGSSKATDVGHLKPETQKEIAYSLWAVAAAVLLLACCFARSVHGVISVLRMTSQFLSHVPSQMLQPTLIGLVQLLVFGLWLVLFVQVASIGVQEGEQSSCLVSGDVFCLEWNSQAQFYGLAFLVLMLYWLLNFLHALSHFGTSYAVGAWYFAAVDPLTGRKEPAEGSHSCCDCRLSMRALCYGLTRHPGSLALGAFVITLAEIGRLLLWWAKRSEGAAPRNPVVACVRRCTDCLADCFARFVEFVSEHAYVEIALKETGFWTSAQKATAMAVSQPALFLLVGRVTCAVRLLGTAVITAGTTYALALLLIWLRFDGLSSTRAPLVTAAIAAFATSQVMMHPFNAAARACLHCFCLDEDHMRALGMSAPAHTPQPLQQLIDEHAGAGGEHEPGRTRRCPCF